MCYIINAGLANKKTRWILPNTWKIFKTTCSKFQLSPDKASLPHFVDLLYKACTTDFNTCDFCTAYDMADVNMRKVGDTFSGFISMSLYRTRWMWSSKSLLNEWGRLEVITTKPCNTWWLSFTDSLLSKMVINPVMSTTSVSLLAFTILVKPL